MVVVNFIHCTSNSLEKLHNSKFHQKRTKLNWRFLPSNYCNYGWILWTDIMLISNHISLTCSSDGKALSVSLLILFWQFDASCFLNSPSPSSDFLLIPQSTPQKEQITVLNSDCKRHFELEFFRQKYSVDDSMSIPNSVWQLNTLHWWCSLM